MMVYAIAVVVNVVRIYIYSHNNNLHFNTYDSPYDYQCVILPWFESYILIAWISLNDSAEFGGNQPE